jgi:hypothetical protein
MTVDRKKQSELSKEIERIGLCLLREAEGHLMTEQELLDCVPVHDCGLFEDAFRRLQDVDSMRHMTIAFRDSLFGSHRDRLYYVAQTPAPTAGIPLSDN